MSALGRPTGSRNKPKREKHAERRISFTLPKIGGAEMFLDLVKDYGGPALVARDLKISRELVTKYASGELPVPYATLIALWWQSWRGFDQAYSETHPTHLSNFEARRRAEMERYILAKVIQRAIELLPDDHAVGEMLALGLHKAKNPPPVTQLQMEFLEPSLSGAARFPFISPEVSNKLAARLNAAGLLPPNDRTEFLMSYA